MLLVYRFPKKEFKQQKEGRYWKKFKNALLERDQSHLQINDVAFCDSETKENARLFAVAISARVDIYKL